MCRSSPFRTTLNTGYITALDMCAVCSTAQHFDYKFHHSSGHEWLSTEAVHCVALWARVTSQLWTCVNFLKYVPKQSTAKHLIWTRGYITTLDMCEVCTEAVHSVPLWTRVTSQLWTCAKCVPKHSTASTLNTGYITAFGYARSMFADAVHSVALWARVTLHFWTCVKYVLKQPIP